MLAFMRIQGSYGVAARLSLSIGLLALACGVCIAQEKKSEGNAVERTAKKAANATERTANRAVNATARTAKKVDKALTHAGEKTEHWVKEKTK
jgi:hypothetical protein